MRNTALLILALLVSASMNMPVCAVSLDEIDTDNLDIPDIDKMDYSDTPLGSSASMEKYANHLIEAGEKLLKFIESIFEMLGLDSNSDVTNLTKVLEDGQNMSTRK